MKKQELQKILKPLIKECIKEVIFEEGILSNLIKEIAVGIGSQQTIVETRQTPPPDFSRQQIELQEEARTAMEEKKRRLEEALGGGMTGIFEGVSAIPSAGKVGDGSNPQSPLSSYAPGDSGVDISSIMGLAGNFSNWKKMI